MVQLSQRNYVERLRRAGDHIVSIITASSTELSPYMVSER